MGSTFQRPDDTWTTNDHMTTSKKIKKKKRNKTAHYFCAILENCHAKLVTRIMICQLLKLNNGGLKPSENCDKLGLHETEINSFFHKKKFNTFYSTLCAKYVNG